MTFIDLIASGRLRRARRRRAVVGGALILLLAGFALTLMLGQSFVSPQTVLRVLAGEGVPGQSFTVGQLRLPRAVVAVLAGLSFGLGGAAFQIMLRNPLASPDIIGISRAASAAAVLAIVVLGLDGPVVSIFAVIAGLGVALLVYGLSFQGGVAGTRLILVGIGVSAMLDSFIAYVLTRAPSWDLAEAMRWLTGSVNGAQLSQALPLLVSLAVFGGLLSATALTLVVIPVSSSSLPSLCTLNQLGQISRSLGTLDEGVFEQFLGRRTFLGVPS